MEEEAYFVIRNSDGDTHVAMLSKTQMEARLKEEANDYDPGHHYFDEMPTESDTNYWTNDGDTIALIIKGRVVSPKPKTRVIDYVIE